MVEKLYKYFCIFQKKPHTGLDSFCKVLTGPGVTDATKGSAMNDIDTAERGYKMALDNEDRPMIC